jgi:hypothetical protein
MGKESIVFTQDNQVHQRFMMGGKILNRQAGAAIRKFERQC